MRPILRRKLAARISPDCLAMRHSPATSIVRPRGIGKGILSSRLGFTMLEMIIVIIMVGILVAIAAPKFYSIAMRYRIDESLNTVAADLRQAVSLAAREQKPVTIALESSTRYVVKDRATSPADTVRLRRDMQLGSDAGVRNISFSPATVTVYANGIISSALTVTLTSDSYARQVTLSVAGQVRVVAAP